MRQTHMYFTISCVRINRSRNLTPSTQPQKCIFQKAMPKMVAKGIRGKKAGIDTSKYTLDQFKFVDDIKYPPGTKVGDIDPHLRRGHGLLLSQDEKAIEVAKEAFAEVASLMDENGETLPLFTSKVQADLRAVYLVALDKCIFESCAKTVDVGTIWEYIHLQYDLPPLSGLEIQKTLNSDGNPDTKIVVLRLDSAWERAVDAVGGGAGRDIHFRAIVGVVTMKKRRAGPRPANTSTLSPPPPPPPLPPGYRPPCPPQGAAAAASTTPAAAPAISAADRNNAIMEEADMSATPDENILYEEDDTMEETFASPTGGI